MPAKCKNGFFLTFETSDAKKAAHAKKAAPSLFKIDIISLKEARMDEQEAAY
jgi:hypothetical protein